MAVNIGSSDGSFAKVIVLVLFYLVASNVTSSSFARALVTYKEKFSVPTELFKFIGLEKIAKSKGLRENPKKTDGNILRTDKEGEITYLNPGMESSLMDIGFEPNELDSIPVEELIEAQKGHFLLVAKEVDHSSAYALSDIAASA